MDNSEYTWKAAWSLHIAGDPAAEDWVAVKALAVLAGNSAQVAADITAEAEAAGLTASQRNGADTITAGRRAGRPDRRTIRRQYPPDRRTIRRQISA